MTDAQIDAAHAARNDPRAIQNARAFYHTLKKSVTGNLKTILFDQADNIPVIEDGNKFFKRMTELTSSATLQLSMLSFKNILHFDPAQYDFKIPIINTKLSQLFVLATTRERQLSQQERVQHALAVGSVFAH